MMDSSVHVVFFTEAGDGIGWGHFSRCTAVSQAFEQTGSSTLFVMQGIWDTANARVPASALQVPWAHVGNVIDGYLRGADMVVIDSYQAARGDYVEIAKRVGLAAYFDDTNRLDYPEGIVINSSIGVQGVPYRRWEGLEYLLGPQYAPLRAPFWEVEERVVRPLPEAALVYFSENDPRNLCGAAVDALSRILGVRRITCISGGQSCSGVRALRDADAEEMKAVMMDADVAVVTGGQILYELARVGVPTVAVGLAENQRMNIVGWQQVGFIEYAGWWSDAALEERLARCIASLASPEERTRRIRLGRTVIDGQGARRIRDRMALCR
jgi:UDP-2,4-diacetamido-2,4,6-trideoxy-beta-L-altropyranose hydrolase